MTTYDEESTPTLRIPSAFGRARPLSNVISQRKLHERLLVKHLQHRLTGVLENTPENNVILEAVAEYVSNVLTLTGAGLQKGMLYYVAQNGKKLDRPYEWTGHHFVDHAHKHQLMGDITVQFDSVGQLAVCMDSKLY